MKITEKNLEAYLTNTQFKEKTLELILNDVSLKNLRFLDEQTEQFKMKDFDLIEEMVESFEIEEISSLKNLLTEYNNFKQVSDQKTWLEYYICLKLESCVADFSEGDFYELNDMIKENNGFFIASGYFEYDGNNPEICESIEINQKETYKISKEKIYHEFYCCNFDYEEDNFDLSM